MTGPLTTELSDARAFIRNRLVTFRKDMAICRSAFIGIRDHEEGTSAFMPGLMTCMAMMELLACLKHGQLNLEEARKRILGLRSDYLQQPCYTNPNLEILYNGFRHKIAHTGQPHAVYLHDKGALRVTFKISNVRPGPALVLHSQAGLVTQFASWQSSFNCMMDVCLTALFDDLMAAADLMIANLAVDPILLNNAVTAIKECYPAP